MATGPPTATPLTPLSFAHSAALNATTMATPTPTIQRFFDAQADSPAREEESPSHAAPREVLPQNSVKGAMEQDQDQENASPAKARHSRILSGSGPAPLKILAASQDLPAGDARSPDKTSTMKSPRKWSPEKRFPVKVNVDTSPEKAEAPVQHREITLDEAMADNKDLAQAIRIFEDEDTMMENADDEGNSTLISPARGQEQVEDEDPIGPDDTMVSTFSTFSAVPNLTMFARIGHTPTKFANVSSTPNTRRRLDLSSEETPRATSRRDSENTVNLLDFTDQIQGFSSRYAEQLSNLRRGSPAKSSAGTVASTPQKRQTNLLDFDIPPLPTPRSIPTVTPRELESLKSGFLSEISSLKASLKGKEAEVLSLKSAVGDAEKRVGECMEELREVRAVKEALADQQDDWQRRGQEMESMLCKVREEIVRSHCERDELESKFEESEKRREAAEIMAQEAESKMAAMRAGKANTDAQPDAACKSPEKNRAPGSREIEIAVEKVSRELHSLYKSKHESKITALKKSYENRWSKKVHELEDKVNELQEANERLHDTTITRVDPNMSIVDDERKAQAVKDSTQIRELNAEIQQLGAVVGSVKADNQELRVLLEKERVEKGELVQLAEEMMSMQSFIQAEAPPPPTPVAKSKPVPPPTTVEKPRSSVSRMSGLRAPGSVKKPKESRIGALGTERKIGGGLPRPGSGMGGRSGIMSSIEKMGNYRGRGD